MKKRAAIIINPVAGKQKIKNSLFDILFPLGNNGYSTEVYITKGKGDAVSAAENFSATHHLIVCCGGDGTLNEVINGIIRSGMKPDLCYFPMGTTNDFGNTLGLPKYLTSSSLDILSRKTLQLDAGCFNDSKFFTYVASFGIFTKASYSTDQTMKNHIGHLAYLLEGAKELSDLSKTYEISLTADDKTVAGNFIFCAITNSTSVGGIYRLPKNKVKLNDGLFEIMLVRAPQTPYELQNIIQMLTQNKFDGKQIILLQSSKINLSSSSKIAWCTDGEFAGDYDKVSIKNLNNAVRILV